MAKLSHSITIYKNIWVIEIIIITFYLSTLALFPVARTWWGRYSCYPQTL